LTSINGMPVWSSTSSGSGGSLPDMFMLGGM
jgi:hypothetical protein